MNHKKLIVYALCLWFLTPLMAQLPTGTDFFDEKFDNELSAWTTDPANPVTLVNDATGKYLKVKRDDSSYNSFITKDFDLTNLRGAKLVLSADVKGENIVKAQPWYGIKVMFTITEVGKTSPSFSPEVRFQQSASWVKNGAVIDIPLTAQKGTLTIGIQQATGSAWFDNIQLKVKRSSLDYPAARNVAIEKYHPEPALRGVMVAHNVTQATALDLKTWKANVVRWQLGDFDPLNQPLLMNSNYNTLLDTQLKKLEAAIPYFKQTNTKIILDLHSLSQGCLYSATAQLKIVEVWKKLATKYKNEPIVWAYDLANEPLNDGDWKDDVLLWEDLAEKIAKAIRLIDPTKPIIIESVSALPSKFVGFKPISFTIPNIIYSPHFYEPHSFSHQGIYNNESFSYPSTINNQNWDSTALKTALKSVKDFQDKYRVPILIGEFSAVRWAPNNSAVTYLQDCIKIFESYNWDWVYHAFRESDAWDVELSTNKADTNNRIHVTSTNATDRAKLLGHYFAKNTVSNCNAPNFSTIIPNTTMAVVNFSAVSGALTYTLEYKLATSSTWLSHSTATTLSRTIASIPMATLYDVRIKANCAATLSSPWSMSQFTTKPTNDEPCTGIVLTSETATCSNRIYSNIGATYSLIPSAPPNACPISTTSGDIWFRLVMPSTRRATVQINGISLKNFGFAFYQAASSCSDLVLRGSVPCQTNTIAWQFFGTAGTVYYIRIWGANGEKGTFNLCMVNTFGAENQVLHQKNINNIISSKISFLVAPNPTNGTVQLQINTDENDNGKIQIIDLLGRVVLQFNEVFFEKGNQTKEINLSDLPNGGYIIHLVSGHHYSRQTILLNR